LHPIRVEHILATVMPKVEDQSIMLNLIYFIRNQKAEKRFSAGIFIQQNEFEERIAGVTN
jgi:hypothetical protein